MDFWAVAQHPLPEPPMGSSSRIGLPLHALLPPLISHSLLLRLRNTMV